MTMTREYQALTKAKFGPGGPGCRCCQPHHTKLSARRVVRRKARQESTLLTRRLSHFPLSEMDDYLLSYDWEEDRFVGLSNAVTWCMRDQPFRLVPVWLREDAEEVYERERALWALAGEQLCWVWGVPVALCEALQGFVETLSRIHNEDGYYIGWCAHTYPSPG